ncbi:precorrin-6y C5,15-methyltransferase (decarboxylating) subunit CbiE [Gordonia sp. CPCC 205515]|uniref:precorrin-6y C5,15-methyltransferase (decarboxylating) subunit CbiE n=1 Tax=Gordonia sp. CPCC 205515 TaxID=3140791 RepID=UPI003AF3CB32
MIGRFVVVGIGADGWDGLSGRARDELSGARVIYGSQRQLDLLPSGFAERRPWTSPMSAHLAEVLATDHRGDVHLLASGDPMFHGVGASVVRAVGAQRVHIIPTVSSVSLACARLGWDLTEVTVVTTVTRDVDSVLDAATDGRDLLILSCDRTTPAAVAKLLNDTGFGWSSMVVAEQLGGPAERLVRGLARTWDEPAGDDLNVIAVSCVGPRRSIAPGRPDDDYDHDGQITKAPIRALTVAALAPGHRQLLWDIGSGSGSVAIEWLRATPTGYAVAFERDTTRADRLTANARRHGVGRRLTVRGAAPEACTDAPVPDSVFIGGGLTETMLATVWHGLPADARLVVNAVTVENQSLLAEWYARQGGSLQRHSVETAAPLGSMTTWRPALPIVQWAVTKA